MKTQWICRWQYIPGREKHFEVYATLDEARHAMAKVLADGIDLSGYIHALRNEEGEDCRSSADFLEKFLSDLIIPQSQEEIPPHFDIPDHCLLMIDSTEGFLWEYAWKECPRLAVSHVYYGSEGYPFIVDLGYQNPVEIKPGRVNSVRIQIDEHMHYGKSAYPLMVWSVLEEDPQTQDQIVKHIWRRFETQVERKAVGRHLQLLKNLGYPVQVCSKGYFCCGEKREPQTDVKYTATAFPLLILQVLDGTPKTQGDIIQAVQEKFGVKMSRQAVGSNLRLLQDFAYGIQKSNNGYYIGK